MLLVVGGALSLAYAGQTADLKQSKFTQIVNDVKVLAMPTKTQKPAALNDLFKMPDILRTGPASRAELVADDNTITRVGANTIFSFDAANRTIDLEKGSVLFHSPKGKGGGQIKTGAATAAVLGTTIIVSSTQNGGFKLLVLEGTAKVTLPNGQTQIVEAGQEVFVLPGGKLSPVINFRLGTLIAESRLVGGFDSPLPSISKIQRAIEQQEQLINNGNAQDTGVNVGDAATVDTVEVVDPNTLPPNLYPQEQAVLSPAALGLDVTITSPHLDDYGTHLFHTPTAVSGPGLSGTFVGLFGRDITFDTETVDLFPLADFPAFTFLAARNIRFNHSVDFFGSRAATLSFVAVNGITIEPDSTISYNGTAMFFQSGAAMSYDTIAFENYSGLLDLQTAAGLTLGNCQLLANQVNLTAAKNMTIQNSSIYAYGGSVGTRFRPHATVAISEGNGTMTFNSGGSMTIENTTLYGETFNATAKQSMQVNSVSFTSFNNVNLAAHTLVLENVNFGGGSSVLLKSYIGQLAANPNTGAAPVAGYVNFINNVLYGGQPAQNFIGNGITIANLSGVTWVPPQPAFGSSFNDASSQVLANIQLMQPRDFSNNRYNFDNPRLGGFVSQRLR
jgi:hypothetical protein